MVERSYLSIKQVYSIFLLCSALLQKLLGICYRHPTSSVEDYEQFSNKLFEIFHELKSDKRSFYYNLDVMKIKTNNSVRMVVNNIINLPCQCAIDLPTRITNHSKTLIGHIYFNDFNNQTTSGKIISDICDHYGAFILTSKYKTHSKKSNHLNIRDMSTFNVKILSVDLNANLNEAELNNSMPVDDYYEKFCNTFKK